MKDQIIETWHINNRVNLMLIDAIPEEALDCTLSSRGGGTVAKQFAHLHNIRLMRLDKYAKELMRGQSKIDITKEMDKGLLKKLLAESADGMAKFIEQGTDAAGKIKGFKRGVVPMLGYLISHESHHRGNIMLTLKQCGHKIPKKAAYGIWAWNQI